MFRLHGACPNKIDRSFWFNILVACCLELIDQPHANPIMKCNEQSLQPYCSYLFEGIWNIGVLFTLYCLYNSKLEFDKDISIRLSVHYIEIMEMNISRWNMFGKFGVGTDY